MSIPAGREPLDAGALRAAVGPRWQRVDVVAETGSTNTALLSGAVPPDRSVLVAEYQSAGRGRLDRTWVSPPGAGLTFSALFRPSVPIARWGWLPLLTGVAVAEAVQEVGAADLALKWPNDVLVGGVAGGKVAGILVQTADDAVAIGVGCNVTTTSDELPVETATSLAVAGVATDRASLLVAILGRLDARVAQWEDCVGDAEACGLAAAYRERCVTIGTRVRITGAGDDATVEGDALDVDAEGHLVVHTDDGTRSFGAGDIEHLRPASPGGTT